MQLNGFSVWITVYDESKKEVPLTEYSARVESEKLTTCWIPSSAGHRFVIHWRDDQRRQTAGYCYIDSVHVGGTVISEPWASNSARKASFQLTSTTSTPFQFSKLELTDDDAFYANGPDQVSRMGVIEVKLYHVVAGHRRALRQVSALPQMTSKIHEKSKKGMLHGVSFGSIEHSSKPTTTVDVHFLDHHPTIFKFRYRPLDVLRADGIAPPAPAPPQPSESVSKASKSTIESTPDAKSTSKKRKAPDSARLLDISDDEGDEVAILEAKLARAKAKRALSSGNPHKKVKEERKPVIVLSGTVIDLT